MIKKICDICGKDACEQKLVMPYYEKQYAMLNGQKIAEFGTDLISREMDICPTCAARIAHLIELLERESKNDVE